MERQMVMLMGTVPLATNFLYRCLGDLGKKLEADCRNCCCKHTYSPISMYAHLVKHKRQMDVVIVN